MVLREKIVRHIVEVTGDDPIISTTGKASRELFEIRESRGERHGYNFLTVGSMGHASSIAFGIAEQKPDTKAWIIDGDGAALMHMGGHGGDRRECSKNIVHIVINNGAHETVGGMPTVVGKIDLVTIAKGCGYPNVVSVDSFPGLDAALAAAKQRNELRLIEVKCAMGTRADLGRPSSTPQENKEAFMKELNNSQQ